MELTPGITPLLILVLPTSQSNKTNSIICFDKGHTFEPPRDGDHAACMRGLCVAGGVGRV
eukprot:scaffold51810_cov25-Tisochrysis_lutea.AAC.2